MLVAEQVPHHYDADLRPCFCQPEYGFNQRFLFVPLEICDWWGYDRNGHKGFDGLIIDDYGNLVQGDLFFFGWDHILYLT
jgi:hypothetical protein